MNSSITKSSRSDGRFPHALCWVIGALMAASCAAAAADPAKASASSNAPAAEPEAPKSIFVMPANKKEGRDPFFPNRPLDWARVAPTKNPQPVSVEVSLTLNGISGTPARRLCIVNGQTLGKGDEEDVKMPGGPRVKVRCLDIGEDRAVIEVNGQRRELHLRGQ